MAYFYAVKVGRKPGVYNSWPECQDQVTGIKGAKFKKFPTKEEAEQFAKEGYLYLLSLDFSLRF